MKKTSFMTWIQATCLAFFIGFAGMATLISGLDLPVSLGQVALWCFLSSALCSFCCGRRLGIVVPILLGVAVGIMVLNGALLKSLQAFLYYMTTAYNGAFGWKILYLGGLSPTEMSGALPAWLCLWSAMTCAVTAWSVTKGQSAVPVVLTALPAPVAALVVGSSSPGLLWLWIFVYGVAMVLITASTRYDDAKRGNRATVYTAIPVALAVILLFAALPKDAYMGQDRANVWSENLLSRSYLRQAWNTLTGREEDQYGADTRRISLAELGTRNNGDTSVLTVTSSYAGTLYLRGSAFDTYDGKNWTSSGDTTTLSWPAKAQLGQTGEVVISTRYAHAMLYMPYYVTSMDLNNTTKGVENKNRLNNYSVTCAPMPDSSYFHNLYPDPADNPHIVGGEMGSQCTQLPESTVKWAKPLVDRITAGNANTYHKAQAIASYVRKSAVYDLSPEKMPRGESDFVYWFLERSDSGYCSHFASAATVLLKAAGIPARYVVGYSITVEKGIITSVTEKDAHAWVEYWLPGFGWTVLETTPAGLPETVVGETGQDGKKHVTLPEYLWIGLIALVPVSVIAQWQIRRGLKKRPMKKGGCKEKVISRYAYLERLHALLKEEIDPDVTALAEKAKFSPYPMANEDVAVLDSAIHSAKGKLRRHNLLKQLYYALFLAEI